jgi:hypothetical protein
MDAIEDHLWARGKVDAPAAAATIVEASEAAGDEAAEAAGEAWTAETPELSDAD